MHPFPRPHRPLLYPPVRLAYVAGVAARILAGYKAAALRHRLRGGPGDRARMMRRQHRYAARRVYQEAVRLQGLMIKLGQTAGSNPVGFPIEYVNVLSRLQDAAPPRSWRVMRPEIERALGKGIDAVFATFDPCPVAAASLAQVYRARLHDGRDVAVKVLYPGIERLVRSDLRVLQALIWVDGKVNRYASRPMYDELARNIPFEVDLIHEAAAMERMARLLVDEPRVVIPTVVGAYTRPNLLVMEWVEGVKITDLDGLRTAGRDVQAIADLIFDVYCRQLFIHGYFHADPHPGNLFALPGDRLAIVDFGLTKQLSPAFQAALIRLVRAMFTGDVPGTARAFAELGYRVTDGDDLAVFAATSAFFRGITAPSTYAAGADAMANLNARWIEAVKQNPVVAIAGDMTLVWRVFALLIGAGYAMGAQPHVLETVLKYTGEGGGAAGF